ncbi:hypothetical protein YC2023_081405 [Brassica napus]
MAGSVTGTLSSGTAKAVKEQLELLGVTGKPSKTRGTSLLETVLKRQQERESGEKRKTARTVTGSSYRRNTEQNRERETRKLMERDEDRRKGSRTEDGTIVLDVVTAVYGGYSPWNEPAVAKIEMQWSRAWRQRISWVRCPDLNNPDRTLCDRDQRHTEGGSTGNRIEFADACGTRGRVTDTGMTEEQDGRTGSGALSMASVLSVQDGWLETKPSLFVYLGHVGMVG